MFDNQEAFINHVNLKIESSPAPVPITPKRFLVHDEIEVFPGSRGQDMKIRIRVWQGKDATPIVLVSQVNGNPHPRTIAIRVANWVNEAILRYPDTGFRYFEDGDVLSVPYLAQQLFEYFGNAHRLRLFKPETRTKDWAFLEHILGGPVER